MVSSALHWPRGPLGSLDRANAYRLRINNTTRLVKLMKPDTMLAGVAAVIAVAALLYTVYVAREDRNAALVSIGVSVLQTDPSKGAQVEGAREWALNLIDANAGGVKFSKEARALLLKQPLPSAPLVAPPGSHLVWDIQKGQFVAVPDFK